MFTIFLTFSLRRTQDEFCTHPGGHRRRRFLQQIPQKLLILCALAVSPVLLLVGDQALRLLPHLLVDVLLALVVLVLAAGLQVQLVDPPVLQVVAERQHAHLLHEVQLPSPVEVEDGGEGAGVTVEEVLVLDEAVVVAQLHDGVVALAVAEAAKPCVGQPLQRPPQHLVLHASNVQDHSAVGAAALGDHVGLGRERGERARAHELTASRIAATFVTRPAPALVLGVVPSELSPAAPYTNQLTVYIDDHLHIAPH